MTNFKYLQNLIFLLVMGFTLNSCKTNKQSNKFNYEAVDLGLSVKWATCNVGANSPSDYGDYFAWGETQKKKDYSKYTYKLGSENSMNKYNENDGKRILESVDDIVQIAWGSNWRMPTKEECEELCEKCTWKRMTNGGYLIVGPNGNSIFLPAAGVYNGTNIDLPNIMINYWSSTISEYSSSAAYSINYYSANISPVGGLSRYFGLPIRPVCN